ncbi:CpsD/CapB family tyrosine-protein kinase [Psychrobacillus psychrotolerans]|uniref:CpsD/CapB family tyrosine-protein kinase n=1 Tax=Psychrobacillus psychrotolerans TaxID=126156 RepID=UPI0033161E77
MFKKKKMQHGRKLVIFTNRKSIVAEQIRTVRANIKFAMKDKQYKTLLFTSTSIGEGKSTLASNIAISFAQDGQKVLLVDADLRKPTMHYTFNKPVSPGLTNLLMSNWSLSDILKDSGVIGLDLITCGPIPSNPAELLGSLTMKKFLKETISLYDLIIFDAPPLLSVADAQILADVCDGTVLVTSSGITEKKNLYKVKEVLEASNAHVLGIILNRFKLEKNHYYYEYYGEKE